MRTPTRGRERNPWLPYRKENPEARLRLFCLPFAGSGASSFLGWSQHLPPAIEICAVQPPGREKRMGETPFTQMAALVEGALAGLEGLFDKPFALFGHSMGSNVVFALARALEARGLRPCHLFPSGRPGPHDTSVVTALHTLADDALVDGLRHLGGTPPDFLSNPALMMALMPCVRADLALTETFRAQPGETVSCPLTAMGGAEDPLFPAGYLQGWAAATTGPFDTCAFPGGHFYYTPDGPPAVGAVGTILQRYL